MKKLIVTGKGDALERACDAWTIAIPVREIIRLEIDYGEGFAWETERLAAYAADQHDVFLAMSNHALNMPRIKIMTDIKTMGYRIETYVSPRASVAASATLGEGCFVDDGAVLCSGVTVRMNAYIGPRVVLGLGAKIGHSVWIDAGVVIGEHAQVGNNTTIGSGVQLHAGRKIGKQCEINRALEIIEDVPASTFYDPIFETPVRIYAPF